MSSTFTLLSARPQSSDSRSVSGETVKAFVALKEGYEGKVKEEEIVAHCKERMAAYKYPRQVEFVKRGTQDGYRKIFEKSL